MCIHVTDSYIYMYDKSTTFMYDFEFRWSELTVWPQGALVKHVKGLFKAEGVNVTAEPGNGMHGRFYVSDNKL